jgi:plasmid stability protein
VLSLLALLALLAELRYTYSMATITIRNLDETVKRRLQVRAALNGRSMEAEARDALAEFVTSSPASVEPEEDLGTAIRKRFAAFGSVELQIPSRKPSNSPKAGIVENAPENVELKDGLGTAIHKLFAPLGGVDK